MLRRTAIHRLDRWTSGLVLLARDPETASIFNKQLLEKQMHKKYLASVAEHSPQPNKQPAH